jgi:hypothetical protein
MRGIFEVITTSITLSIALSIILFIATTKTTTNARPSEPPERVCNSIVIKHICQWRHNKCWDLLHLHLEAPTVDDRSRPLKRFKCCIMLLVRGLVAQVLVCVAIWTLEKLFDEILTESFRLTGEKSEVVEYCSLL